MKILIFSAVAMMAFVGTSFGKSGEVKIRKIKTIAVTRCMDVYHARFIEAYDLGVTQQVAGAIAFRAYKGCMGL